MKFSQLKTKQKAKQKQTKKALSGAKSTPEPHLPISVVLRPYAPILRMASLFPVSVQKPHRNKQKARQSESYQSRNSFHKCLGEK